MTVAGGVTYTYDQNGNQTGRGSDTFAWTHENRLTSATVSGTSSSFDYTGDGLRDRRSGLGSTAYYTWDLAAGLPVLLHDDWHNFNHGPTGVPSLPSLERR